MAKNTDPYEEKLFQMFSSFDKHSHGRLDKESLTKLCQSLELKDHGQLLINHLIRANKQNVSFEEFKVGLLDFLATDLSDTEKKQAKNDSTTGRVSPNREISPKFVVGVKKYGRRSRPEKDVTDSSQSETDDNESEIDTSNSYSNSSSKQSKVQRSVSQSDVHGNKRRRPVIESKLKRCASLPMQKGRRNIKMGSISQDSSGGLTDLEKLSNTLCEVWNTLSGTKYLNDKELMHVCEKAGLGNISNRMVTEVFAKLQKNFDQTISFREFISLIESGCVAVNETNGNDDIIVDFENNFNIATTISSTNNYGGQHNDAVSPSTMPYDKLIGLLELEGVTNVNQLLRDLNLNETEYSINQILCVLDEEVLNSTVNNDKQNLFRASSALRKAEANGLRLSYKQLMAENLKLASDNKDANRRVALLAQEVDERHATLEKSAQNEIKTLKQRHAEYVKDLSSQLINEKEQVIAQCNKFETAVKSFENENSKLKSDLQKLREDKNSLEEETISLQKQLTDLLETNIKLNSSMADLEDKFKPEDSIARDSNSDEVIELVEKMTALQMENSNLRDRNDELQVELDEFVTEVKKLKAKLQIGDDGINATGVKRRGDSPSKSKSLEESPRIGKVRKFGTDNETDIMLEAKPLESELSEAISNDPKLIESPANTPIVQETKTTIGNGERNLSKLERTVARCEELETLLEQMRKEFDKLEDYWQGKLNEERQIFDDEQRENDDRFAELLRKISEYEEQFAIQEETDSKLNPILENSQLEEQYASLECEFEEYKKVSSRELEKNSSEMKKLKQKLSEMRCLIGDNAPLTASSVSSPASSPINYLWQQSTIQAPARDYHNPMWNASDINKNVNGLTTTSTTIFSTVSDFAHNDDDEKKSSILPIQKPKSKNEIITDDQHSVGSFKTHSICGETHSVADDVRSIASTHSVHRSLTPTENHQHESIKENVEQLKTATLALNEQVQHLTDQRNTLLMEIQQLQEAKPVLEKTYMRPTVHPNVYQRLQLLEQRNRYLQNSFRQQQQYMESCIQQSMQQRSDLSEMHNRLESQAMLIAEQAQRLTNADLVVKDLYVENSILTANIQKMEQQKSRSLLHHGLNGVPGLP